MKTPERRQCQISDVPLVFQLLPLSKYSQVRKIIAELEK